MPMKMRILSLIVFFACISLAFNGCVSEGTTENTNENTAIDSNRVVERHDLADSVYYATPALIEMYDFLNKKDIEFNASLLSKIKTEKLLSEQEKAIGFGQYLSNLAYVSIYDDFQKSIHYYKAVKSLSSDLGMSSVVNEKTLVRLEKNMDNKDSIIQIIESNYKEISVYLENNKKSYLMSVVAASAWLESMYISISLKVDVNEQKSFENKLLDQAIVLDNIWMYLQAYKNDKAVADMINLLTPIYKAYQAVEVKETEEVKVEKKGNKLVFGGAESPKISKNQLENLKTAIINAHQSLNNSI